ncbi:multicomponent Na+:H+ antiporter subunit C [Rhodobium orientis]|uniref:Cation:proton antiporter n=1 Tax=Rhodobium orientis TaxID=34017 RepID=A0A327JM54_9HYPH|nr:NADH-quinone oxidoreductase subunit K [Rhodobium orientis]MBB4301309.1 multicomponent Na+:H+ antiporter subunit C [Rhodobium orientis]MBK5951102.1 cation:proton antiporter [Rhodobium orientis]RAI26835.1 cation:proton antiporter [Rhodobium orientis]
MILVSMAAGFLLILMGLYGALTNRNILRMIVAFTIASTGVNLVLVSVGYLAGRTAPILDAAVPVADAAERIIDPVPQALVLTAIVIGLGITALMLAYAFKLYETKRTLDISKFTELKG